MSFVPKSWENNPSVTTPISASALMDLEQRVYNSALADARSFTNVKAYGATGDGTTDDTAAVQAAVTAVGAGGTVYFPKGTYSLSSASTKAISVTGNITLIGDGESSVLKHSGTVSTGGKNFIECSGIGSRCVFRSLKMVGPTLSGSSSTVDNTAVFHSSTTTGTLVINDCYISGFAYSVRTWSGGTHRVEVYNSRIEGANFITPGSMGLVIPGALGAELIVDNCDFSKTGETADTFHCHCIYIYEPVAFSITRCRFDNVKGRYFQSFSGTGTPKYARFTDCWFGPNIPVDVQGVITNSQVPTIFTGCRFDHPGSAVQVEGDAEFNGCVMNGAAATTFYPQISVIANGARISVRGGIWPSNNQFVIKLDSATNVRLKVSGVQFTGQAFAHITARTGSSGSLIEVEGCSFFDNSTGGRAIEINEVVTLTLRGNRFQTTKDAVNSNQAGATIRALFNDFSQTGASIGGTAPTTKKYLGNYGSVGLADA
jgi:hypothetical protein